MTKDFQQNPKIPDKLKKCIEGILGSTSVAKKEELKSWEGEKVVPSKYTKDLKQINEKGIKIPPYGWSCSDPKCPITDNLWLCLTCGHIGCGRKFFDGSGGNNHASDHHKATGHPLVVKLGTITSEGKADIYSYFEDKMVIDPDLEKHLKTFGIDMSKMKKTTKTLAEMELDSNLKLEQLLLESTKDTEYPVFGPGYTGMKNLGNSCYMASTMQVLFTVPDFIKR